MYLAFLIITLNVMIPALIIGILAQHKAFVKKICFLIATAVTLVIIYLRYDLIIIGIRNAFGIQLQLFALLFTVFFSIICFGSILTWLADIVAGYIEKRTLTPPGETG